MSGVQSLKENGIAKGSVVNLKELNVEDLRRLIAYQQREIALKNDRLRGVEKLTTICSDLEEKVQSERTKSDNYEIALRRAEARIAYLNKKLGIGPQTSFDIDVIYPGVSRKDFDAVAAENIRLKEALEHIVPTELGGKDIVIKNKELYELVTTLQDDLARREHHITELESTLNCSNKDDLVVKVNELLKLNMKLERSLQAKQVFSEKLLKENKKLTDIVEQNEITQQMICGGKDISGGPAANEKMMKDITDGSQTSPAKLGSSENIELKKALVPNELGGNDTVASDVFNEEREKLLRAIEDKDNKISELEESLDALKENIKGLEKRVSELTTELKQMNDRKVKSEAEISEMANKCADFQKKCAGFFNQVLSLNTKQLESEEEISSFKRTVDTLRAQVAEKEAMMVMMRDALNTHESDFRREHEEKLQFQNRVDSSQQESERLRRENQSHMATIRHFGNEIERMTRLLMEPRKPAQEQETDDA